MRFSLVSVCQTETKMGTYTTNYQLYTPTVGETGWGTLVNTNFTTIDNTMAGLNTRLTAVENEVNGALSCTSVTTSGTITSTGLITANGGIKGNLTGTADYAKNLQTKTLTFASTSIQISRDCEGTILLPRIPGVVYSGTFSGSGGVSWTATFACKAAGGGWTNYTIGKDIGSSKAMSNIEAAYFVSGSNGSMHQVRVTN